MQPAPQGGYSKSGQQEDRLGDFIQQNQDAWDQRGANYDQIVNAFSNAGPGDMSNGVELADAAKYGSGRVSLGGRYVDAAGNRVQVLSDSEPSIGALLQQAQGLASDLNTSAGGVSDADLANWRQENLARMQTLAAQTATDSNTGASSYETGIYSDDPGSADYYRQRDGRIAIQVSGVGNGFSNNAGASVTGGELAREVAVGAVHALVDVVAQPTLQVRDLGAAALSVGYNELVRPFTGGEMWLPELRSGVATAYAQGTSQGKLLASVIPVVNVGVFSYDTTSALLEGRNRDAARAMGGFLGGMAVGAGTQRYGNYGVQLNASGFGSLGGNAKISLVHPNLVGSGKALAAEMGGVPAGHQAHHLIMSELASGSSALKHLAAKGLYNVNRAPNGRGYPGNPLAAADTGLPLHSGYHGPEYRGAVRTALSDLDLLQRSGASDKTLLMEIGHIERQLAGKLEKGQLWLNEADALHRGLGNYSND